MFENYICSGLECETIESPNPMLGDDIFFIGWP